MTMIKTETIVKHFSVATLALWAKKGVIDGQPRWLPLIVHLADAYQVGQVLYNTWLSDGQKAILAKTMSDDQAQNLFKFICFTHDLGKATPAFQTKESYGRNQSLDAEIKEALIKSGFQDLNNFDDGNAGLSPHTVTGEALLSNYGVPESIGAIIGGHHGKPLPDNQHANLCGYPKNYWQSKDTEIQAPWRAAQQEIFQFAMALAGYDHVSDIPQLTQPQAVIVEGLLIMTDWLASTEYLNNDFQIPLFPLIRLNQTIADLDLESRLSNAIASWSLTDDWIPERVTSPAAVYHERWGFCPRPVQQTISETIGQVKDPGIFIIEAPMGMGKTEIALTAAEQLMYKTGRSGLFFGLPTQATSNAIFDRVHEWMLQLPNQDDLHLSIKLMHGRASFNQSFQSIPRANHIEDQEDASSVLTNTWFSGKKTILDNFTIGTIDNLLLMSLRQKHLALRHLGLSKKVVVIDEVHAYDAFMSVFLDESLEWLGAYNVPVVILSATLPKNRRNTLIEAYYHGKFNSKLHKSGDFTNVSGDWTGSTAYPLMTYLDNNELRQLTEFSSNTKTELTSIVVKRIASDLNDMTTMAIEAIQEGGVAGIIVNTVVRAQQLLQLIPSGIPTILLHSAFLAPDRDKLERKLQKMIGKSANRPTRMIVIGTQVLEQSLDIDFDILITDIAPIDLLLQRAGRLHRHSIRRPSSLSQPQLIVSGIDGPQRYEEGATSIYGDYLLMKSDHFLPDKLVFPNDISTLVQLVYDEKTDHQVSDIQQAGFMHKKRIKQKQQAASGSKIAAPRLKETLHNWVTHETRYHSDEQLNAKVRDIEESIEVILLKKTGKGIQLLDNRALTDIDDFEVAQQVLRLPARITRFHIGDVIKALEQETNRYCPQWAQSQWLNGSLLLMLNENDQAQLADYHLTYSPALGLIVTEEGNNDSTKL